MKLHLSLIAFISSCAFSVSVHANEIQDPVGFMLHEAKAEQCDAKRSAAKVSKGVIDGLGEVTVVALPSEGCGGGNNWGTSIKAFYQGKVTNLGGAKSVERIVIKDNQVVINDTQLGDNDPDCCPTQHETLKYISINGKLVLRK